MSGAPAILGMPMSEDHAYALAEILKQERKSHAPKMQPDRFFELFVAEQALKTRGLELDQESLKEGNTGGGNDGGIDGFYVFVNRKLLSEDTLPTEFPDPRITIEVVVVQATRSQGFSESALTKFRDFAKQCLRPTADLSHVEGLYHESILEMVRLFRKIYKASITKRPELIVSFFYGTMGYQVSDNLETLRRLLLDELSQYFLAVVSEVTFLGAPQLLGWYNKTVETTLTLNLATSMPARFYGRAYVGLAKLGDFAKFITDESGALREHLFESNVRDYQGDVRVNQEIARTLEDESPSEDFWWLNNGVTILAADISGDPESLAITDPLIVNGLQTSFEVYRRLTKSKNVPETHVLVRIVKTQDAAAIDRIIKATNNQTKIPAASLHATEELQREIEIFFKANGMFYDRRKNYYGRRGVAAKQIVTMPFLGQSVAAIALQKPHDAKGIPGKILTRDYKAVFKKGTKIRMYLKCAQVVKAVDSYLYEKELGRADQSNLRFHTAMLVVGLALKSPSPSRARIADLNVESIPTQVYERAYREANRVYTAHGRTDRAAKGSQMTTELLEWLKQNASQKPKK
jgi:hypothetical protein